MLQRHFLAFCLSTAAAAAQTPGYQDKFFMNGPLRIHYLDWGNAQKPAMILVHGIGRTAHSFDHIAPSFQANYQF